MGPDKGFGDVWDIHASVVHDRGLEMSPWHLALHKDHFDILYVRFYEGHVGPNEGFGDVWDIHAIVVHDEGLEMSSWHCRLCTRIILTFYMWGLVEAMWVQMKALEMFGTFMPVLFMIGVWKCHLDTCLHISELLKAVECFIFIVSCVWQSMSHKIWCPKVLLPLKLKILILRPIVRAPQSSWLLVLKSFRS